MKSKQSKKIAILDDDDSILSVLDIVLSDAGYQVATFTKPTQFLDRVNHEPFDLALIDVFIGSDNGCTICQKLKKTDVTKQLPVVLMSADENLRRLASAAGADECLEKPFDIDDVVNKVKRYAN